MANRKRKLKPTGSQITVYLSSDEEFHLSKLKKILDDTKYSQLCRYLISFVAKDDELIKQLYDYIFRPNSTDKNIDEVTNKIKELNDLELEELQKLLNARTNKVAEIIFENLDLEKKNIKGKL